MKEMTLWWLVAMAACSACMPLCVREPVDESRPWLAGAVETAGWIRSSAIETGGGTAWPADPDEPDSVAIDLYKGVPGVVLFFLELHRATGCSSPLDEAMAGADYLLDALPGSIDTPEGAGLYTGVAGIGFVLEEVFKATGRPGYREGALRCVRLISHASEQKGWCPVTDIISGRAGAGLFMLYAARNMDLEEAGSAAARIGRSLLEDGIPENGGMKWPIERGGAFFMPNFSHGTAGVCFFLVSLYKETGEDAFLEGALAGARYLEKVTNRNGLIFHHEPGGENLFYLGWCHGPPGTARLYYMLWKVTGDKHWLEALHRAAEAVMQSGVPEKRPPGFWNNAGVCCGSAGVAGFFLSLHKVTGAKEYLVFARRAAEDMLSRGMRDDNGLKWVQAEHRVRPGFLVAQTGYMQGVAGIGMLLLQLDAFDQGEKSVVTLPDDPF